MRPYGIRQIRKSGSIHDRWYETIEAFNSAWDTLLKSSDTAKLIGEVKLK